MAESSESRDVLLNQLADEFATRRRGGGKPDLEEYCVRYPDLAADIRELFPALIELERARADAGPEPAVDAADPPPVTHLGDFRLLRKVGRGGMGVVYEAEQVSLGRRVAIKLLPPTVFRDPVKRRRFEREARAAARLHHTNIVPVHGFGEHAGTPYYVMQFIPGLGLDAVIDELGRATTGGRTHPPDDPPAGARKTLSAALARSLWDEGRGGAGGWGGAADEAPTAAAGGGAAPEQVPAPRPERGSSASFSSSGVHLPGLPRSDGSGSGGKRAAYWPSVARIGLQVAGALAYAHKLGVLHRDIKPANLLLDLDAVVWVTDFGLAKADDSDDLTHTGDLLGTLRYMPPEAFDGKSDARSDVYSLGLTLFELVAFRPAFGERDRNKLVKQVTTGDPPRLRKLRRDAPRDLVTIVEKAIAREPNRRYQTAAALADDLQRFLDGRPVAARRATELERLWMWARRRPATAGLIAALFLCLLAGSIVSAAFAVRADRFARDAELREKEATLARDHATRREGEAVGARTEADQARAAAEVEAYNAVLSEVRALRVGHPSGWRGQALRDLARLAVMPAPHRDVVGLRTEAAAVLGTPDVHRAARVEVPTGLAAFAFGPDGRTLVTADTRAGLEFWDLAAPGHRSAAAGLPVAESRTGRGLSVAWLPDGRGLAVATRDRGVVFTDARGVRADRPPITRGEAAPTQLAVSGDGLRLAVGWAGGAWVTVHDAADGAVLAEFGPSAFALSPDGRRVALQEGEEVVLRPVGGGGPRVVLGRNSGTAAALAFSPDGGRLAAAFFKQPAVVIWDVARRELAGTLRGHRETVLDVAFSPDGEWVATGGLDYTTRVWEARTGQLVATLPAVTSPAFGVRWSPAGDWLAAGLNNAREVGLYAVTGRHRVQRWLAGHARELGSVVAHPTRDRLATAGYDELNTWDLGTPRPAPAAVGPDAAAEMKAITALTYSPDGSLLAAAGWPQNAARHQVVIRDADTGRERGRVAGEGLVYALAFDASNERLACGDTAGNVVVRDVATGRPVRMFKTGSRVHSVALLDDPRRLLTHGRDAVLLFDLDTGDLLHTAVFPGREVSRLAADPGRGRVVVGFEGGALAGVSLPALAAGPVVETPADGRVRCLALSPDGRLAASGSDHRVVLRDAATFAPLLRLPPWDGTLRDLTFDAGGRRLAVVGTGFDVDLWDVAALRAGLAELGLGWDAPPPSRTPEPTPTPEAEHARPAAPVIGRPRNKSPTSPAESG
jgi:serine/threonine protein kinase/WD40 repeat protein